MPFELALFGTPPSLVELVAVAVIAAGLAFRARPKQGSLVLSVYTALIVAFIEELRVLVPDISIALKFAEGILSITLGHIILLSLCAFCVIFPIRRYVLHQKGRRVFTRK